MKYQRLRCAVLLIGIVFLGLFTQAYAQNVDQIRWKNEAQVRAILGEPQSITSPVGTHASYTMWKYPSYTVAFSNGKAFHLFDKNSLRKFKIVENRSSAN